MSKLQKMKSLYGLGNGGSGTPNRFKKAPPPITKGFGDDLGQDIFDPENFGDDLGFDGFDPEGGPITKLIKKEGQTS